MAEVEPAARRALAAWLGDAAGAARLSPLGEGHINDTWLVEDAGRRLVLQRINEAVFPDPLGIARKVAAVSDHVAARVPVAPLLATTAGDRWLQDRIGVWRLCGFIARSRTLQTLASEAQAEAAGRAFGRFQRALVGLPLAVAEPIPGFLRLGHYLAELDRAENQVRAAPAAAEAKRIAAALQLIRRRGLVGTLGESDRLIHGDCKLDNLLFHESRDEVLAVIDLDTVMPGHWAWDFGDLVRSTVTGSGFSVSRFAALARGFAVAAGVSGEADALVLAPRYLALMLAVRFLTDHLRGDRYFKVAGRGDNLERAWAQLRVLEDLERHEGEMRAAVAALP